MPSYLHEVPVEMFRYRPMFAAELLTGLFGVSAPAFQRAHVSSGDLTDVAPTEYRADAVITLTDGASPAVVMEEQLRSAAVRDYVEALMDTAHVTYGHRSDFARRYYGQGRAEGEAKAVLAVLGSRGIDVPDQVREDITGCTDLNQLDTWVRRAGAWNLKAQMLAALGPSYLPRPATHSTGCDPS